jgi:hypothetical protein
MGEHAVLAYGKSVEIEVKAYCSLYVAMCVAILPRKCVCSRGVASIALLAYGKSVETKGSSYM